MMAKYLTQFGHQVTVLRSGEFNNLPDYGLPELENVKVVSFIGDNSDAEKFRRGEYSVCEPSEAVHKVKWLSYEPLRRALANTYYLLTRPQKDKELLKKAENHFQLQKRIFDEKLHHEQFDVVFSTYSCLENIYAGEYASKLYNAVWVQDFRDPVTNYTYPTAFIWNNQAKRIQRYALKNADLCTTVSEGLTKEMLHFCSDAKVKTIYNGYESSEMMQEQDTDEEFLHIKSKEKLTICYTGLFYTERLEALKELLNCMKELTEDGLILSEKWRFIYAGSESETIKSLFDKYGMMDSLEDYGYVSRSQACKIQKQSDIFLVLSWNKKKSQGVLTGKFYEGIRAEKPILSVVVGDLPNSELYMLEKKYNYGFCYEKIRKKQMWNAFKDYIMQQYNEKMKAGSLLYKPSQALCNDFRYDQIVKKLEDCIAGEIQTAKGSK